MKQNRHRPVVASITIRRLVLSQPLAAQGVSEAIAAAIMDKVLPGHGADATHVAVAQAIAGDLSRHIDVPAGPRTGGEFHGRQ
jgi:hypothetical protein